MSDLLSQSVQEYNQDQQEKEKIEKQRLALEEKLQISEFNKNELPEYIRFLVENGISEEIQAELKMECTPFDRSKGDALCEFSYYGYSFFFVLSIKDGNVEYGTNGIGNRICVTSRYGTMKIQNNNLKEDFFTVVSGIERRRNEGWHLKFWRFMSIGLEKYDYFGQS
jgi:hypothetical protein